MVDIKTTYCSGFNQPRPYMVGSKQTGHYRFAFQEALNRFKQRDPCDMAAKSGTDYRPETSSFIVRSFNREIEVGYPGGETVFSGTGMLPLMGWRLVIINYLVRAGGKPLQGQLITYKELENGLVFYANFYRNNIMTLSRHIKDLAPEKLGKAYRNLGAETREGADLSVVLPALPRFPITIKLWFPDDELPGSANILFDASANNYLHTEDISVISSYAVAFAINEYRVLTGEPWRKIVL